MMFNQFFDCLNVRSLSKQQKPDSLPYTSPNDKRLEVNSLLYILSHYYSCIEVAGERISRISQFVEGRC